jgi:hypothetical protein
MFDHSLDNFSKFYLLGRISVRSPKKTLLVCLKFVFWHELCDKHKPFYYIWQIFIIFNYLNMFNVYKKQH